MQSRLKIPLLFGLDVVHGMRTTFPIPLAEGSRFSDDRANSENCRCRNIRLWHSLDICTNGRYFEGCPLGKGMEGSSEDPWLGSQIARARINGFQVRITAMQRHNGLR